MSTSGLPSPTSSSLPTPTGSTFSKGHKRCYTCKPTDGHMREWMPDPNCPKREGRTLILCFDGTGDSFDADNSNVVQFLSMLMKDDPGKQLVYYQAGIGTYTSNVLKTPITESVVKTADKMLAININDHVKEGYLFLMQNYHFGDQICIFGFSRGAYTARALAGMLQKIGLLPRFNLEQFPFAYAMYKRRDRKGLDLSLEFKRTFSIDVRVKFLGVWDTVESVGVIPKDLPFSGTNSSICHFRHAVALDEHRVKFIPSFYIKHDCNSTTVDQYEIKMNTADADAAPTDFKEVFFAGAHCDIGGGSVENETRHSLARITLRWMIRECFKTNTGIVFDAHMLKHEAGLDIETIMKAPTLPSSPLPSPHSSSFISEKDRSESPTSLTSRYRPLSWIKGKPSRDNAKKEPKHPFKGEYQEELDDAISPIYDQLKHWYWKWMEYFPWVTGRHGDNNTCSRGSWKDRVIVNCGEGRIVYRRVMDRGMKVHRSVRTRIETSGKDGGKEYLPLIRCSINGTIRPLTREEWLAEPPVYFEWVD